MAEYIPAIIIGFREGLEAFLIVVIMIRYLQKTDRKESIKYIWRGAGLGIILSVAIGAILYLIARSFNQVEPVAKLWESGASLVALALVTTFIIWMIKNGSQMTSEIQSKLQKTLSNTGIVLLTFAFIAREGVEIAIFTFAGDYTILGIFIGILLSLILSILIFYSLVKVNLKLIFNITLVYLVLQAGFLLGYAVHEGLSAFKDLGYIASTNPVYTKLFNLGGTLLDHKTGGIGLPLYILIGWYSRPEIIQFIVQYTYTFTILGYWLYFIKKQKQIA